MSPETEATAGILIAPSILACDFAHLGDEVKAVETAGADWIHVDVMDGHFVPNLTIGPPIVEAVKRSTSLPLDVHLMIEEPERYIEMYVDAGADTLGVHVETCPHLHSTLAQIRKAGARACAVLNPATSPESLRHVLEELDQVLLMSVNPGFGGQTFIQGVLPKVEILRGWIDERGLRVDIEIDGGITCDTIGAAATAGVNVFVAGTAVFGKNDYKEAIEQLRHSARHSAHHSTHHSPT